MKLKLKGINNVYQEIAGQYKNYIRLGVLKDGERLPSCRELAMELGINPNTVERAYSLLEAEGFVITIPKKGVYVAEGNNKKADILAEAEKQLSALKASGLSHEEVNGIIRRIYLKAIDRV